MPPYRYGKELGLHEEEQPVDAKSDNRDDEQDKQHVLSLPSPLRNIDQITQPTGFPAELHDLGQHDVAERQAEDQPQRVEDAGKASGKSTLPMVCHVPAPSV